MFVSYGGDSFKGSTDQEAVNSFLNWQENLKGIGGSEYITNLLASLQNLRVSKVSIEEVKKTMERRKRKERKRKSQGNVE